MIGNGTGSLVGCCFLSFPVLESDDGTRTPAGKTLSTSPAGRTTKFDSVAGNALGTGKTTLPSLEDARALVISGNEANSRRFFALIEACGAHAGSARSEKDGLLALREALDRNEPFSLVLIDSSDPLLEAWEILQRPDAPTFAILDWNMLQMEGYEVCRKIREARGNSIPYILMVTCNSSRDELLKVLIAGAEDYLLKPFEPLDPKIRLRTACRILSLLERLSPAGIK